MAHGGSFTVNVCEKDSYNERSGESGPSQKSSLLFKEPAFNVQEYPEAIQMGTFIERLDSSDSESTSSSERSKESLNCKPRCSLQRNNWSAATKRVLSSMPSRTTGLHSSAGIAMKARRTPAELPPRTSSHDSLHTPRVTQEDGTKYLVGSRCAEGSKEQLVSDLRGLSVSEGMRKLRAMPLSLVDKREIRKCSFSPAARNSLSRNFFCNNLLSTYISRMWRHCTFTGHPIVSFLKLWNSSLKKLSGRYGTGVLSYFLFLRTILFINLLLFTITCLFLVIPQAIHPPPTDSRLNSFTGIELLTGTGYLSQSLMFYGYYSNVTIEMNQLAAHSAVTHMVPYCIPTAYFFTITISFFIICIVLVYSMSKSFGKSFQVFKSTGDLSEKVFCSWDFKVIKRPSIRLQSEKISTQLK
ncbi:transmembrane channel-like protein 6, partial [Fundulus heteroclitus]|uniref:transmembrane channel-like protein 6 n=1 Tax=Fundulus heteroclitus TaxID=8078 RepID=UPI00165AB789